LTVDGQSYNAPLLVRMDPRVHITPAALQKKFQAESELAKLASDLSQATLEANSLSKRIERLGALPSTAAQERVSAFQKKLAEIAGRRGPGADPDLPSLTRESGRAATLYGQVWQADAEPTAAQLAALNIVQKNGSTLLDQWRALKSTDLPSLNAILQKNGVPALAVESTTLDMDTNEE